MSAYGRNHYPRRYGGGLRPHSVEHAALLDALTDAFDVSTDSDIYIETYAYAVAIAIIWSGNGRTGNQGIPARMFEALSTWEEACRLRPAPSDSIIQRRKRVAAKLRGLAGNDLTSLNDTCEAIAGQNFSRILSVPTASQINYWPGVYPGPPGFEFSSNRLVICVELVRLGLSDSEYTSVQSRVEQTLNGMVPAYMTYVVGDYQGGFTCDVGVCGETLI